MQTSIKLYPCGNTALMVVLDRGTVIFRMRLTADGLRGLSLNLLQQLEALNRC